MTLTGRMKAQLALPGNIPFPAWAVKLSVSQVVVVEAGRALAKGAACQATIALRPGAGGLQHISLGCRVGEVVFGREGIRIDLAVTEMTDETADLVRRMGRKQK